MDPGTAYFHQQSSFHLKPKTLNPTLCHPFLTPKTGLKSPLHSNAAFPNKLITKTKFNMCQLRSVQLPY